MGILLFILCYLIGVTLIAGALLNWKWLVDPPGDDWPYLLQARLGKYLGKTLLRIFCALLGLWLIVAGFFLLT